MQTPALLSQNFNEYDTLLDISTIQTYSSERRKLYQFCDFKTKVKLLKITSFLPFLTQIRQKFGPKRPLNLAFLAIIAISFHAGGFTTCFVTFFITLDLI